MNGFAGILRERVALLRRTEARDALGAGGDDWTLIDVVWASVRPEGHGPAHVGDAADAALVVRVTLRPCAVRVGDRIERIRDFVVVREVIDDPALPDRIVAIGELLR